MDKQYDFKTLESKMLELWEQAHAFNSPEPELPKKQKQKPFSIIMPPPNANDPLHIGHAMFVTVEDILTRFHRMLGDAVPFGYRAPTMPELKPNTCLRKN
jgi:valyl-tRNA synthetase